MSEFKLSENYNYSDYLIPHGTINNAAVPPYTTPEFRNQVRNKFKLRPESDIFIVTYPKSGSTWMQSIVREMLLKEDPENLATMTLNERLPWTDDPCEMDLDKIESWPSPRAFKCHHHTPKEMDDLFFKGNRNVRIIYVTRDPRDIAVSLYHHLKKAGFSPYVNAASFDDFHKTYMRDKDVVYYGLWEHHMHNWLSVRKEYNILCVKYEDLIADALKEIRRVAAYLGVDLTESRVEDITARTSFKSMLARRKELFKDDSEITNSMLRKGIVGDWVNHFQEKADAEKMRMIAKNLYQKHGF